MVHDRTLSLDAKRLILIHWAWSQYLTYQATDEAITFLLVSQDTNRGRALQTNIPTIPYSGPRWTICARLRPGAMTRPKSFVDQSDGTPLGNRDRGRS
ncbi:hypothetical protein AZA_06196 [Nitrospirillum viridazoti Y2]|nr:hypothetical protein AZA_06196 [Nitrospirillum amazonense Y2]